MCEPVKLTDSLERKPGLRDSTSPHRECGYSTSSVHPRSNHHLPHPTSSASQPTSSWSLHAAIPTSSEMATMASIVWIDDEDEHHLRSHAEEETMLTDHMSPNHDTSSSRGHHHHHTMSLPPLSEVPKTSNMPLDMNIYATRKTVAQGMMDIALMTANASQLKYVLLNAQRHKYLEATISLITLSILIQVIIGIILIFLGRWNINYRGDQRKADLANNVVVILIFLVTVVNVMVSAFGPTEMPSSSGLRVTSGSADNWSYNPPAFKLPNSE